MTATDSPDNSKMWGRLLLLAFSVVATGLFLGTRTLITPYPENAAWFESSALFPRFALVVMALGGLIEVYVRRQSLTVGESEELDSSAANMREALGMLALFALYTLGVGWLGYLSSTLLFLLVSSAWLRLGWRVGAALSIGLSLAMWLIFVKALKVYFGHAWLI